MRFFSMNGFRWRVVTVPPFSPMLIDRTNKRRVATTDPETLTVYISSQITGGFRVRVLIHELGHCALYSFGLIEDIHRVVPIEHWIDAEEWICNLFADYGLMIFRAAYSVVGNEAWTYIPRKLNELITERRAG